MPGAQILQDSRDQLFQQLGEIEQAGPDPYWHAASIGELIASFDPRADLWTALISRYAGSRSVEVVSGLAWGLAKDAERGNPDSRFEHILSLVDKIVVSHDFVLSLSLRCLTFWAMMHARSAPFAEEAPRVRRFLLQCFRYEGEAAVKVRSWIPPFLDQLNGADLLPAVFPGVEGARLQARLRVLKQTLDSTYAGLLDELIDVLNRGSGIS